MSCAPVLPPTSGMPPGAGGYGPANEAALRFICGRREAIALIVGAAAAWPFAAAAQQQRLPVIGFLSGLSSGPNAVMTEAFRKGLGEAGYVEGRNVAIQFRWAEGQYDRLPELAADLVRLNADVIASSGGVVTALAAKRATSTIPIVFTGGDDPVRDGLVMSMARPGGNVTGASVFAEALVEKRIELLHELAPAGRPLAVLLNPSNLSMPEVRRTAENATLTLGRKFLALSASTTGELDGAIAAAAQQRAGGVITTADPFIRSQSERLIDLAARHAVAAVYASREAVAAGGLMSYGPSLADVYRQAGQYAGRILGGEKPADLPVLRPTRFELAINLRTANTLGLTIPLSILARADEVIE